MTVRSYFWSSEGFPVAHGRFVLPRVGKEIEIEFLLDPASPVTVLNAWDLAPGGQSFMPLRRFERIDYPGVSIPVAFVPGLLGFPHSGDRLAVYQTDVAVVPGSTAQPDFVSRLGWDILQYWHTDIDLVADALRCDVRESDFDVPFPTA